MNANDNLQVLRGLRSRILLLVLGELLLSRVSAGGENQIELGKSSELSCDRKSIQHSSLTAPPHPASHVGDFSQQ